MKKSFLILNCSDKNRSMSSLVDTVKTHFKTWEVEVFLPKTISDFRTNILEAVKDKIDTVMIGGGDGSIGLAASLIAGSETALLILPLGTVNTMARALGISLNPFQAIKNYDDAEASKMDVVSVNGRYFLCFMSIGFDAYACHLMDEKLKKYIGRYAYLVSGIKALFHKPPPFYVDNEEYYHLILSNISNYAGIEFFPESSIIDAKLNYVLYKKSNIIETLKRYIIKPMVEELHTLTDANPLIIEYLSPLYLQIDGEPIKMEDREKGRLVIMIHPKYLKIHRPPSNLHKKNNILRKTFEKVFLNNLSKLFV